jgi:hypothetical protein
MNFHPTLIAAVARDRTPRRGRRERPTRPRPARAF